MRSRSKTNESSTSREQQNVLRRVASMPLVSSTYNMAATAYNSIKSYPYTKPLWDAAEKGIETISKAAVYSAQPILTKLEPQIAKASEYANKSLDTLEEKLPVLQMTADKVASNTNEMVSAKMASAKDSIASTLSGVVRRTKEAVQSSMAVPKSVIDYTLTTVGATRVGRMAVSSAEALLLISEMLVQKYIPISDEELKILNDAHAEAYEKWLKERPKEEDEDMIPDEEAIILPWPKRVEQGYFERLGTLLWKLRCRSYHHSIGRIKQHNIQDYLFWLQQRTYCLTSKFPILNKGLPQQVVWLDPSKPVPKPKADNDKVEPQSQTLLSRIQRFPSNLKDGVRQIHQSIGELHTTFQKLPSTLLAQHHEKIITVRGYIDDLVHFLAFNTPLYWLLSEYVALHWPFVGLETDEDNAKETETDEDNAKETETESEDDS